MGLYFYKSIDVKGKKRVGRIEASTLSEAKEKLRLQGTLIIDISLKAPQTFYQKVFNKKKDQISKDKLLTITTQLTQLISAGIPLYESLVSLTEQYKEDNFHPILLGLCEKIKGGSSLSQALTHYPESFDTLYISLISAGESVGALQSSLEKLTFLIDRQLKLKKQLITALIYPSVLCLFSALVVFLLLTFAIPSIEMIFEDREVNGFTKTVINLSHFMTGYWMFYLPLIACSVWVIFNFLSSSRGKLFLFKLYFKLPIVKNLVTQAAMSRFSRTMGSLQLGGVDIIESLKISKKVMANPILEEIVDRAEEKVMQGSPLSLEFKRSSAIPILVSRMIAIGEESGNTATMFHKIADFYEAEVEKTLNRLTALAQPLILLVMGAVVGVIMMAILLPLTDVNAFISN